MHFQFNLIFINKARRLNTEWCTFECSTEKGHIQKILDNSENTRLSKNALAYLSKLSLTKNRFALIIWAWTLKLFTVVINTTVLNASELIMSFTSTLVEYFTPVKSFRVRATGWLFQRKNINWCVSVEKNDHTVKNVNNSIAKISCNIRNKELMPC
jgi:hypothetical protein